MAECEYALRHVFIELESGAAMSTVKAGIKIQAGTGSNTELRQSWTLPAAFSTIWTKRSAFGRRYER